MEMHELAISGCYEITPFCFYDDRGVFVKTFHQELFKQKGISIAIIEEFYSISHKNVFRGLHFQLPPAAHNKLVFCLSGAVDDYLIDLRKHSQTYGKSLSVRLSAKNRKILFLPIGIAHGFLSLTDNSIMIYKTDHVYSSENDSGILWSSCGLTLSCKNPIVSSKDNAIITLEQFESPFI